MAKKAPPPGYPTAAPPLSSTSATTAADPPAPTPIATTNPLPLSAAQEAQVRDMYYARVRGHCAAEIKGETILPSLHMSSRAPKTPKTDSLTPPPADFATCALNRTVSATWACRPQRLAMNGCMIAHANRREEDLAREEWFLTRGVRQREREERERLRVEQEKWHREWWGLPPKEGQGGGIIETKEMP